MLETSSPWKPQTSTAGKHVWIEHRLDVLWRLAVRIVRDPDGNPVIGELRIFPNEDDLNLAPGEWSADELGVAAPVPRGGIPAMLLKKTIRLSRYVRELRDSLGPLLSAPTGFASLDSVRESLTAAGLVGRRAQQTSSPAKRDRGRPPLPAMEYAEIARDYVEAIDKKPIKTLMAQYGKPRPWVTSRIARARAHGYLTASLPGRTTGSQLTELARAVLSDKKSRQKGVKRHVTTRKK